MRSLEMHEISFPENLLGMLYTVVLLYGMYMFILHVYKYFVS